jgi:hypothetical protein
MPTSSSLWPRLLVVGVYAVAMAVVEAMVVYYLRRLFALQYGAVFAQGRFTFPAAYLGHEQAREAATIVMLVAVALLAGRGPRQWLACFLFAFGVWDIGYYVALRVMLGWPASLTTRDLLFLIPVQWWEAVWVPLLASVAFIAAALALLRPARRR